MRLSSASRTELTIGQKLLQMNWPLVILIGLAAAVGIGMLYSAANASWSPWAKAHAIRFAACALLMLTIALIDVRFWMRLAYPLYFAGLVLLGVVEVAGETGMGAKRWIDLGVMNLQPSELMKIALVLALARYFHGVSYEDVGRPIYLIVPIAMIGVPAAMVMRQPDLGTALMIVIAGGAILFAVGVRLWKFALVGGAVLAAAPVVWSMLKGYQKARIMTFINPENDPLGAGYHILQSKIALGSGGVFGKGFVQGTQSHLNFLPEKQTDFIFTMMAEEFGMLGGVLLITLYLMMFVYGFAIALRVRSQFARVMTLGLVVTIFLYVFINVAMVMGLIPVVGVPLPLISYGGTAMMSVMIGFGLILSASIHRDVPIGRHGAGDG